MPRRATPKPPPSSPASSTPVDDPLADLREDDARYPAPEGGQDGAQGPQEGPEAPGEADPLTALILERLEAAMAIPLDPEGVISDEARQMAQALAMETAADLEPHLGSTQAGTADEAVARWHRDTVAVGFLHKGGRCGCAYLARVILGA